MGELTEVANLMQQATMNINTMAEQMGVVQRTLTSHTDRIKSVEMRMQHYEDSVRLTRDQSRRLRGAIHAKVDSLLGIRSEGGVTAKECLSIDKNYRGKFIQRCYHDARTHSRLGTPYTETRQKDYDECIDYKNKWEPEVTYEGQSGVSAYMQYLNDRKKVG